MTSKNSLPSGVAARLGFLASPAKASRTAARAHADLDAAEAALAAGLIRAAHAHTDDAWAHLPRNASGAYRRYERIAERVIQAERAER